MASKQSLLLDCLEAAGRDLTRLHRAGLIEVSFKGGNAYYRHAR
jgi:hypothetical protein